MRHMYDSAFACGGPLDRSFFVTLLPQLEQQSVFDALNHRLSIFSVDQATIHSFSVGIFSCPSDSDAGKPKLAQIRRRLPEFSLVYDPESIVVASSYGSCQGSIYTAAFDHISLDCRNLPIQISQANGCITDLPNVRLASVVDGISHTMIVAEKAATVLRGITEYSLDYPKYYGLWFSGDMFDAVFTAEGPPNAYKTSRSEQSSRWGWTASSLHPGGLNILMADGSVRFIKDSIDSGDAGSSKVGVWQKLATRNGGELIEDGSY